MSVTGKSMVFLALTFALSWGVTIGAHYSGLQESAGALGSVAILTVMMTGPAIAALICTFAFEAKGTRIAALGLHFRPNLWWALAWVIPIALAGLSVAATILLSDRHYADIGRSIAATAEAHGQHLNDIPAWTFGTPFILFMSAIVSALFNAPVLTLTEELGWRGYLHHLWRPAGFWRASLATGAIWGLWHAPAILLYGLNYPDNAQLGVGLFIVWCALLGPIMTLIRDRGGSVWAAGIAHGTINAIAGLTLLSLNNPAFPWNGMVGYGGFVALAIGCAIVWWLQRTSAPAAATSSA